MEKLGKNCRGKIGERGIGVEIISLAIPAIFSMLVVSLYSICDIFFLSAVGKTAVGGVCYPVTAILQGVCMTFAFGSAVNISRCVGAGKIQSARSYFSSGLLASVALSVILGVLVGVFSLPLAKICGGGEFANGSESYLAVSGFSFVFLAIYMYFSACLRAEGRAVAVMIASVLGLFINGFFDFLSVKVFSFGVFGVALSTAIAQILASIFLIAVCFFRSDILKLRFSAFDFSKVWGIIAIGSSAFFRMLCGGISGIAINFVCGKIGGELLSGVSVASRVCVLMFSFGLGLAQGMQPVLAFYSGGGDNTKAMKSLKITLLFGVIFGVIIGVVQFFFAGEISMLFSGGNAEIAEIASGILKASSFVMFMAFSLVIINMAFQARGDAVLNVAISVLRQGLIFVPTLLILAKIYGSFGVVVAHAVSDALSFAVAVFLLLLFYKK